MIFWIDAQLSPQLAPWFAARFGVVTYAVRDLGLRDVTDRAIFDAARAAGAVVITKDGRYARRMSGPTRRYRDTLDSMDASS